MLLNPLQIKLAIAGVLVAAAAMMGLTIWALLERSGRLECKVEVVQLEAQVDVLANLLDEQTKSINDLGQATHAARLQLRELVGKVDKQHGRTRDQVATLEQTIKATTPVDASGRTFDCRDAIKAWRQERKK